MLNRILGFFSGAAEENSESSLDVAHLAALCLMVRAAHIDGTPGAAEHETLRRLAMGGFGLTGEEADTLLNMAEAEEREASDLFRWTRQINATHGHDRKVRLIEMLWEVVLADGRVDDYEANLLRRIAGLIYIPDREAGAARKRALKRLAHTEHTPS